MKTGGLPSNGSWLAAAVTAAATMAATATTVAPFRAYHQGGGRPAAATTAPMPRCSQRHNDGGCFESGLVYVSGEGRVGGVLSHKDGYRCLNTYAVASAPAAALVCQPLWCVYIKGELELSRPVALDG